MHHLTDLLKKEAVINILKFLKRPGTVIIGDLMWDEAPEKYKNEWDKVYYDEGESDFPSSVDYMKKIFVDSGAEVKYYKIHPLVGIIKAEYK